MRYKIITFSAVTWAATESDALFSASSLLCDIVGSCSDKGLRWVMVFDAQEMSFLIVSCPGGGAHVFTEWFRDSALASFYLETVVTFGDGPRVVASAVSGSPLAR